MVRYPSGPRDEASFAKRGNMTPRMRECTTNVTVASIRHVARVNPELRVLSLNEPYSSKQRDSSTFE
jgi:hypothetical protein